jgi:hypothetical protein
MSSVARLAVSSHSSHRLALPLRTTPCPALFLARFIDEGFGVDHYEFDRHLAEAAPVWRVRQARPPRR